jgi:hypothetical protein
MHLAALAYFEPHDCLGAALTPIVELELATHTLKMLSHQTQAQAETGEWHRAT